MSQTPDEVMEGGAEQAPSPRAPEVSTHGQGEEDVAQKAPETDWEALADERTADLQRLQAEYANYKKRVDRDRALARQEGVESVVKDLMPVLDSIALARSHEDLAGGFKLVADELEKLASRHGLQAFGEVGELFDPVRHEALMQMPLESGPVEAPTIAQVIQLGYVLGEKVVRPARVGVASP